MAKVERHINDQGTHEVWWFRCPGCNELHGVTTKSPTFDPWGFNGDPDHPTFTPSFLTWRDWGDHAGRRCHSFITDGQIQFLNDCTHALANQTVELPDLPKGGLFKKC
jgi:hypothetical protein